MQGPFHVTKGFLLLTLLAALTVLGGCLRIRPATAPLRTVSYPGAAPARTLVVLLPGRRDSPEDFGRQRFPERAARAGAQVDMVAVDAHLGYYYNRTIVDRLREDVIGPARKRYDRIWLVGISVGGTGSLLYAIQHPRDVDGIVVLAPFLGDDKVIAEVRSAGGPRGWRAPEPLAPDDYQHRIWGWLGRYAGGSQGQIPLYLGYGRSDSFAPANGMLGEVLPPGRVFTAPGGHAWRAWNDLWEQFLRTGALNER